MGIQEPGNPFDQPLGARIVAKAEEAVARVTFFTTGVLAQAAVAHLVFHEAGFGADRTAHGELSEAEEERVIKVIQILASFIVFGRSRFSNTRSELCSGDGN